MTTTTTTARTPSTTPVAAAPDNVWRDTVLVYRRSMRLSLRNPVWTVMGLAQPLLYLFLFGPLLTKISDTPGFPPGDAWQIFVPAIMVMLGLFGAAFVGFGLVAEWRDGVIDRMRVTPMSRFALLAGRVLRDVVVITVQAVLLVSAGFLMGLRAPFVGVVVGVLLVAVMGATMSSLSYAVALILKSEDALAPLLNGIMLPIMLLSGIMLPISRGFAPDWLYFLSRVNPMSYVVEAARAAFLGTFDTGEFWTGLIIAVVLAAGGLVWATSVFRRQSA